MLLYDSPVSGNCYKVRLLLHLHGIEFERREVDVVDARVALELLGGLNPALRVPTLVLDDGEPLAESNAILCYFAEGTDYLPDDRLERARVLQWMFFEQYSHEPYDRGRALLGRDLGRPAAGEPRSRHAAAAATPRSTRWSAT